MINNQYNGVYMRISDILTEMPAFSKQEIGAGLTQLSNERFVLAGGYRTSGFTKSNQTRLKYVIYDLEIYNETQDADSAEVGFVELIVEDGTGDIIGLQNIELKPKFRKGGRGAKIVQDLIDTTKDGLNIYDIKKRAVKFWQKVGTKINVDMDRQMKRGAKDWHNVDGRIQK